MSSFFLSILEVVVTRIWTFSSVRRFFHLFIFHIIHCISLHCSVRSLFLRISSSKETYPTTSFRVILLRYLYWTVFTPPFGSPWDPFLQGPSHLWSIFPGLYLHTNPTISSTIPQDSFQYSHRLIITLSIENNLNLLPSFLSSYLILLLILLKHERLLALLILDLFLPS